MSLVHDRSRPNFGITDSRSNETWLVRLSALRRDGTTYQLYRSISWRHHGGKIESLSAAREARDQLLEHPDVRRFHRLRAPNDGNRYHRQQNRPNKRAFSRLPGISLGVEKRPGRHRMEFVKASAGSPATGPNGRTLTKRFSIQSFGVRGALTKAIEYRETCIGEKAYAEAEIERAYQEAIRKHGARWRALGWALTEAAPKPQRPPWRDLSVEEFRHELPPKPFQVGVSVVVSARSSVEGERQLSAYIIAADQSRGTKKAYFTRTIQKGLWSAFRDGIKAARKHRGERRLTHAELREQYDLWIKGRKRKLKTLGVPVDE